MSTPTPRPEQSARSRAAILRWLIKWHRRLGITAVVFVILFALTGIALNHATSLGLDRVTVTAGPVLRLYDLEPAEPPLAFDLGAPGRVGWVGGNLYLEGERIAADAPRPVGAVAIGDLIVVASESVLWLFLPDGRLVERVGSELLPGPIDRLGASNEGKVVVQTQDARHAASPDALQWSRSEAEVSWSSPTTLTAERREALLAAYRGAGLPLDRVLLDLHSGRLFGAGGALVADLLAVIFILLGVSGLWMWLRTRRRERP